MLPFSSSHSVLFNFYGDQTGVTVGGWTRSSNFLLNLEFLFVGNREEEEEEEGDEVREG